MYDGQEELDNLVWDKNDEDADKSLKKMRLKTTCREVERLAAQRFRTRATLVSLLIVGGFNILYRVHLAEDPPRPDVMVRLPCPSLVQFPGVKTLQEAATAKYIAENTQIPIPRHFFYGRDPTLGPFIILQHVENRGSMSARLTAPSDDPSATHALDPDMTDATLEDLWGKAASCLVQLSRLTFPRIGALVEVEGDGDGGRTGSPFSSSYAIAGRPITHNMTDMVRLANVPRAVLPSESRTYGTADEWYVALAEMHLAQLVFQHNDAVESADDCRNKFVARQVFRRLAKRGLLSCFGFAEDDWSAQASSSSRIISSPAPAGSGAFRLWGDDLRAGNMLLSEADDLVAVIDWEFPYAAPTQFVLEPPWWLLLDPAETWPAGIDDWTRVYEARLKTWLAAVERAEDSIPDGHPSDLPVPLSTYMRESWETGRFWLSYGARKSWAFDMAYWKFLDERLHLLTDRERAALEPFVERKMRESKDRIIVDWDPVEARKRLSEVLLD
ncbi:phosphotransferase [Parachaetomium inaequale]|uniref:Phosphotransferase n=1 Tax=Parachaetomium inaequale TaxID=2588326 RepID=A0AAN6PA11_9PEZI|nr:phosphotransferase [Parachaetomium inaequale]